LPIWLVLALTFGSLTAITATVIGIRFYVAAVDNALDLALDIGDAELSRIGSTVDAQFQPAADQARFLADYISRGHVSPDDEERLRDLLLGSVGAVRQLSGVGLVRPDLRMVWASALAQGRSYLTEAIDLADNSEAAVLMRQAEITRTSFWAGPLTLGEPEPLLVAVAPVTGENGRFVGVVGAAVSLRTASIRLATIAGNDRVPFVVTEGGRIVMHSNARIGDALSAPGAAMPDIASGFDPVLAALPWPPQDMFDGELADRPANVGVAQATVGGRDYLVVYRRITGYGPVPWYIGYHVPQSWAQEVLDTINDVIPFAAMLVGIALLLALWLGRAIGNPIRAFAHNARRIARLDLDTQPIAGSRLTELDMAAEAQGAMRNGLLWLRNYIPRSLAPVLLQSGEAIVSAERDIVVLFTDIVGFSGIAEGRDAEKLAAMLNRHFGLLGAVIEREGGTIDKYIGDSVMAFWGAPLDQDDRAKRAVSAAIGIARRLHADNMRRARKGLKPIRIRIGLHEGPALVGNIGAPGRINYTLVGDTVNVAQRLEQFGRDVDDGSLDAVIVISAELAAAVPDDVACVDLGEHLLPGRSSAMHLYQIRLA
jgi:class 3 adenylate cyclase